MTLSVNYVGGGDVGIWLSDTLVPIAFFLLFQPIITLRNVHEVFRQTINRSAEGSHLTL